MKTFSDKNSKWKKMVTNEKVSVPVHKKRMVTEMDKVETDD
jgi:hypothetical protein